MTADEFAPKLLGRTPGGKLLHGYARLPYVDYREPYLSALAPVFTPRADGFELGVEVRNFGLAASRETSLTLAVEVDGKTVEVGNGTTPALKPYEKTRVWLSSRPIFERGREYAFTLTIHSDGKTVSTFRFKATPLKASEIMNANR
jgi:hypothetical protein